jgi:arylsulfatase A-like enzyme
MTTAPPKTSRATALGRYLVGQSKDGAGAVASIFATGALTGLIIGVLEAAYAVHSSARASRSIALVAALVLAVTSLASALVAISLSALRRLARWAIAPQLAFGPRVAVSTLAAIVTIAPTLLLVRSVAARRHALLGSVAVALGAIAAGGAAWTLSIALGKLALRPTTTSGDRSTLWPRLAALAMGIGTTVFVVAMRCAWPLTSNGQRAILVTAAIATLSASLLAESLARAIERNFRKLALVGTIVGALALGAAAMRLRPVLAMLPWGLSLWLLTPVAWRLAVRWVGDGPPRRAVLALVVIAQLAAIATATNDEATRKIVATRAVSTELGLSALRAALDWDRDGYPRWMPGGDCRDDDPTVHPGAMDWPGDDVDTDCDGRDDRVSVPPRRPLIVVPERVVARPNVLLLTVDALRADHLGAYGYGRPTSRSLDALARESVVFDRAFANAPSTRLSMPAIATGRWAPTIEWDNAIWWPRFTTAQRTIAEALHDGGYHTGAVYSIPYFRRSDARGFERGVDEYDDRNIALHAEVGGPHESTGSSAREVADSAISFVERNRERAWFLWAHFFDPHHQYVPHEDGVTPVFGSAAMDRYDAEVHYTDQHVGRLLDRLRASGQWERTVIIVTGDHGEGFGEHDVQTHGFHLYAAQTRVPMIVRVPGVAAKRTSVAVSHVDIAPTVVNLAGVPNERTFLGRTMVDAIAYSTRPDDDGEALQEVTFDHTVHRWAIATATHHVLWNQTPHSTRECYDMRRDPDEREDLFGVVGAGAPCAVLFDQLSRYAVGLRLGSDFAEKLAFGVIAPEAPTPPVEHPIEARFATVVDVRGWDGPTTINRSERATVTLHFTVLDRIEPGWELFVHLMGEQQSRNLQHAVIEGAYPIARWRMGQRLRDRFSFTVPLDAPPGQYALYIGFYKGEARLPITPAERGDALRRVRLGTITVR